MKRTTTTARKSPSTDLDRTLKTLRKTAVPKPRAAAAKPAPAPPPPEPEPEPSGRRSVTASLFTADLAALEAVRELIYQHARVRGDRSLPIKLALRLAAEFATGDRVREVLGQIRSEDGRARVAAERKRA